MTGNVGLMKYNKFWEPRLNFGSKTRDDHTHWVMDIQPYPIQLFRVIPGSSWVELNRVGYGYYLNYSTRI